MKPRLNWPGICISPKSDLETVKERRSSGEVSIFGVVVWGAEALDKSSERFKTLNSSATCLSILWIEASITCTN